MVCLVSHSMVWYVISSISDEVADRNSVSQDPFLLALVAYTFA